MDLIKPLLSWRKYLLANKLLKIAVNNYVTIASVNNNPTYMKTQAFYYLKNQFDLNQKTNPDRLLEAVDMLAKNKHILKFDNPDLYKVFIQCSPEGERALNDGYYIKQAYKIISKIGGITLGVISGLVTLICKLI